MNPHVIAIATIDRAKTVLTIPINTIIPPYITTRRLPKTEAKAPASGPIMEKNQVYGKGVASRYGTCIPMVHYSE